MAASRNKSSKGNAWSAIAVYLQLSVDGAIFFYVLSGRGT